MAKIPPTVSIELEGSWAVVIGAHGIGFQNEMAAKAAFPEGAISEVYVNMYERNPAERAVRLQHYGRSRVHGMSFADRYGATAASFI